MTAPGHTHWTAMIAASDPDTAGRQESSHSACSCTWTAPFLFLDPTANDPFGRLPPAGAGTKPTPTRRATQPQYGRL